MESRLLLIVLPEGGDVQKVRVESGSTPADRTLTHDMAGAPGNRLMVHVELIEGHWMLRGFFYEARGIKIGDINT